MKVQSMLKNDKKRHQNNIEAFIFQFEHISHMVLVFIMLILSLYVFAGNS